MMEIYINRLLQILSFYSRCRRFEMGNFFRRPTMVAYNISQLVATQNFFHFYGPAPTQGFSFEIGEVFYEQLLFQNTSSGYFCGFCSKIT